MRRVRSGDAVLSVLRDERSERRGTHRRHDRRRGDSPRGKEEMAHLHIAHGELHDGRVLLEEELVLLEAVDRENEVSREFHDAVGLLGVVPNLLGGRRAVELLQQRIQRQLRRSAPPIAPCSPRCRCCCCGTAESAADPATASSNPAFSPRFPPLARRRSHSLRRNPCSFEGPSRARRPRARRCPERPPRASGRSTRLVEWRKNPLI